MSKSENVGLSKEQIKYALGRISFVLGTKLKAIKEKHQKEREVTDKQKIQYIRDGDVWLRNRVTLETKLADAYEFDSLAPDMVLDEKAYNKDKKVEETKASKVRDIIMFGEAAIAKVALEAYVKGE